MCSICNYKVIEKKDKKQRKSKLNFCKIREEQEKKN